MPALFVYSLFCTVFQLPCQASAHSTAAWTFHQIRHKSQGLGELAGPLLLSQITTTDKAEQFPVASVTALQESCGSEISVCVYHGSGCVLVKVRLRLETTKLAHFNDLQTKRDSNNPNKLATSTFQAAFQGFQGCFEYRQLVRGWARNALKRSSGQCCRPSCQLPTYSKIPRFQAGFRAARTVA